MQWEIVSDFEGPNSLTIYVYSGHGACISFPLYSVSSEHPFAFTAGLKEMQDAGMFEKFGLEGLKDVLIILGITFVILDHDTTTFASWCRRSSQQDDQFDH
jgi:hypothetical protein